MEKRNSRLLSTLLALLLCLNLMPEAAFGASSVYAAQPEDRELQLGECQLTVQLDPAYVGNFDALLLEVRAGGDTTQLAAGKTADFWNAEGAGGMRVKSSLTNGKEPRVFRYKIYNGADWEESRDFTVTWKDGRIRVTKVAATATGLDPKYGDIGCASNGTAKKPPVFTVTEGAPAYFCADMSNGSWEIREGSEWREYSKTQFTEGTYRYTCQVRIDGEDSKTHVLEKGCTVTVNGVEWGKLTHVSSDESLSSDWIISPEVVILRPDDFPLQAMVFNPVERSVTGKAIEPVDFRQFIIGGKLPYRFKKLSGPAWLEVGKTDGLLTGTPGKRHVGEQDPMVVRVTDAAGAGLEVTIAVGRVGLSNADKTRITKVVATVTGLDPKYGDIGCSSNGTAKQPPVFTVTEGAPAYFCADTSNGRWEIREGLEWSNYSKPTFGAGIYRYTCQVRIDGEDSETHVLENGCTVTVNGVEWGVLTGVRADETVSYDWVDSPEIIISAPEGAKPHEKPNAVFEADPVGENKGALLNLKAGQQYSVDGGEWISVGNDSKGKVTFFDLEPCEIRIIHRGDGSTALDSEIQTITVTRRPVPAAAVTDALLDDSSDGKITGLDAGKTYWVRSVPGGEYEKKTGVTEIAGLQPGRYNLIEGGEGTALASPNQELCVETAYSGGDESLLSRYGCRKLTDPGQRKAYLALQEGLRRGDANIDLPRCGLSDEQVKQVFSILRNDDPTLYRMTGGYLSVSDGRQVVGVKPVYHTEAYDDAAFVKKAAELLQAAEGAASQYDRALALHDALAKHMVYDKAAADAHNAYGAIVNGKAVCEGYARAYQYLLQQENIVSYIVTGDAGGGHAWNLVQLDGKYYHVDVTFDDPSSTDESFLPPYHAYFAVSDDAIGVDHEIQTDELTLDACPESRLHPDYAVMDAFTPESVGASIRATAGDALGRIYYTGTEDFFAWCGADSGDGISNLQKAVELSGVPVRKGASLGVRNCGREYRVFYAAKVTDFAEVGGITADGLRVIMAIRTHTGTLVAAGYNTDGREVAIGTAEIKTGERDVTVTGEGFDRAASIRLFLIDAESKPVEAAVKGE